MSILKTLSFIANHPLNRQRRAQSLIRFATWQIGSRLTGGRSINNWINGTKLIAHTGETGATGNVYCGLHEFSDMSYVLHVVSNEDLFVDVGANIGAYTILACGAKGARGICFEPVPATFQRLSDNLRLNALTDRVNAMNIGISNKDAELMFSVDANCMNRVVTQTIHKGDVARIPVRTLDSVLSAESPTVIKIDVEGFELPVVEGAHDTLSKPSLHSVIMELNGSGSHYGYEENAILQTMQRHGFAPYTYEPFSRKLLPVESKRPAAGNLLFVRDMQQVMERIASAPTIDIGSERI